jgi:predicted Zn-dependent protease with MMP-like domain
MDNHEQLYSADDDDREQFHSSSEYSASYEQVQSTDEHEHDDEYMQNADEFDYNREPPLDRATATSNRQRSKYVFMTLCFLMALILFYTYITHYNAGDTSDWFPLVGGIILALVGVMFLRSPDGVPEAPFPAPNAFITTDDAVQAADKRLSPFEELVQEALASIPEDFHEKMENVTVRVAYEPDEETLARVGVNEGHTLLGLYEGVPLTTYGRHHAPYPEVITIYQRTIEDYCRHNPTRIREQVRSTVLHEVAHHFGMDHEEMPIWVK